MPMTVKSNLSVSFKRLHKSIPGLMYALTHDIGEELAEEIKKRTPVETGEMRSLIKPGPVTRNPILRRFQVVVTGHHNATSFVEFGTRPHIIEPIPPGESLKFYWVKGYTGGPLHSYSPGGQFYFKRVFHPGTVGEHMFARGTAAMELRVARIGGLRLNKWRTTIGF